MQIRRIVPFIVIGADAAFHRRRKGRILRIPENVLHLHAVLFADISQIINKTDQIPAVFRHGKAIPGEGRPCVFALHPVLPCLNAAAAVTCAVSFLVIDCRTIIRNACQLDRTCLSVCSYGTIQFFQLRRLVVNFFHKRLRTDGIAIFVRHQEYIDTVFRHGTGSGGIVGARIYRLYAVRRVYGCNLTGVCFGSFLSRPVKLCALSP